MYEKIFAFRSLIIENILWALTISQALSYILGIKDDPVHIIEIVLFLYSKFYYFSL